MGSNLEVDISDTGTGPALLFLPGSFSTKEAWGRVLAALDGQYRLISVSLPGYGKTPEIRPDAVTDMKMMQNFVARIVQQIGEPVHLVGHSYGGLNTFAATLSGAVAPLSLITFEANPIYSLPDAGSFEWLDRAVSLVQRFERAYASGDTDAAALIIDFWGTPGFFESMPEVVRDYCRHTTYTNVLDWRTAAGFTPKIADYASINIPASLVRGDLANQAIVEITALLSQVMPQASQQVVPGAGHFLISTHPEQCAKIIDRHMISFYHGAQQQML